MTKQELQQVRHIKKSIVWKRSADGVPYLDKKELKQGTTYRANAKKYGQKNGRIYFENDKNTFVCSSIGQTKGVKKTGTRKISAQRQAENAENVAIKIARFASETEFKNDFFALSSRQKKKFKNSISLYCEYRRSEQGSL